MYSNVTKEVGSKVTNLIKWLHRHAGNAVTEAAYLNTLHTWPVIGACYRQN